VIVRVGVLGAGGRMGSVTCDAVANDDGLELVARVGRDESLEGLTKEKADVAVDFTSPDAVKSNVLWCVAHGINVVVGTTGLSADDLEEIDDACRREAERPRSVFVAPNFAVGAVLMMRFAALAAPHFARAEIVERHHENKLDAPSGTALRTAAKMNEARLHDWLAAGREAKVPGSRGGDVSGIAIHSLRLPGSVAHQEVILGGPGETLTIRHDSIDRSSFMPGVILAVKRVAELTGVTVGLEQLLDEP
jgi:4-hydroxy-tetrahydrodipicolinate reductase